MLSDLTSAPLGMLHLEARDARHVVIVLRKFVRAVLLGRPLGMDMTEGLIRVALFRLLVMLALRLLLDLLFEILDVSLALTEDLLSEALLDSFTGGNIVNVTPTVT